MANEKEGSNMKTTKTLGFGSQPKTHVHVGLVRVDPEIKGQFRGPDEWGLKIGCGCVFFSGETAFGWF